MNCRNLVLPIIISMAIFLVNCSKEKEDLSETELVFHSLVSEKDTIAPGETTTVTADATGSNLPITGRQQLATFWARVPKLCMQLLPARQEPIKLPAR